MGEIEAMLVNPATGALLMLVFTGNIYDKTQMYALREYDRATGTIGPSMANMTDLAGDACRAFNPVTSTLSFGCSPVHQFRLGAHNATCLTSFNTSTAVPKLRLGG